MTRSSPAKRTATGSGRTTSDADPPAPTWTYPNNLRYSTMLTRRHRAHRVRLPAAVRAPPVSRADPAGSVDVGAGALALPRSMTDRSNVPDSNGIRLVTAARCASRLGDAKADPPSPRDNDNDRDSQHRRSLGPPASTNRSHPAAKPNRPTFRDSNNYCGVIRLKGGICRSCGFLDGDSRQQQSPWHWW